MRVSGFVVELNRALRRFDGLVYGCPAAFLSLRIS
jgi:hypothetical protein